MLCGLAAAPLGCNGSETREMRECEGLIETGNHEQAAMICETAYHHTKNPRAGLLAARARAALGDAESVGRLATDLRATPVHADALRLAGDAFFMGRQPERAIAAFREELALRREADEPVEVARCAYKLAYLARATADYRSALHYADLTQRQARAAGRPALASEGLEALYATLFEIGDMEASARVLDEARTLARSEQAEQRLRIGQGSLYLRTGRPRIARATFEQVLEAAETLPGRVRQAAHTNLVETNLLLGDPPAARRHVDAAWGLAAEIGTDEALLLALRGKVEAAEGRWSTAAETLTRAAESTTNSNLLQEIHYDHGVILEGLGSTREAELAYGKAIELIEESRRSLGIDDYKEWLLTKRRRPYERLFGLQALAGDDLAALASAERMKARTLLDAFVRAASPPTASKKPEGPVSLFARHAGERLDALESLGAWRRGEPHGLRPMETVMAALKRRHILFFVVTDREVWRIAVEGGEPTVGRLDVDANELEDRIADLLSDPEERSLSDRLGEELLGGLDLPPAGSTMNIVTDGPLGRLPFSLLRIKGRYLVEDFAIAYAPSLHSVVELEARERSTDTRYLILADPLGDLPAAAAEARALEELLQAGAWIGSGATSSAFLEATEDIRLLHLATHSTRDAAGPSLTLADGKVYPHDILQSKNRFETVVLASCASAARPGEGIWGSIAAAFLAGGARTVVASLWSIDDHEATELIVRFYEEGGAADPAGALARAQREFLMEGRAPSSWAPFVLLGSGRAREINGEKGGL